MMIGKVAGQDAHQMSFVEDNHVIQALTSDTADEPLDVRKGKASIFTVSIFREPQV
jgi:hypothetical protein